MLGFEQLERLVERTSKSDLSGYPPFNIEQFGENSYRITLAVAGFAEDDWRPHPQGHPGNSALPLIAVIKVILNHLWPDRTEAAAAAS